MPTCLESLASHGVRDRGITCQHASPVSSFDAMFFSFVVIVVEVVHTIGKV